MNKSGLLLVGVLLIAPLAALAEDSGYQVQQSVGFAANSAKLSDAAERKLREDVESLSVLLRYRPDSSIEIAGYAASSEKKPGPLADSRAQKVWEYLIAQGLPAERMEPVGHGAAGKASSRVDIRISAEDALAMSQFSQPSAPPPPAPVAPVAEAPIVVPAPAEQAAPRIATPAPRIVAPAPTMPSAAGERRLKAEQAAADRRQAAADAAARKREQDEQALAARRAREEQAAAAAATRRQAAEEAAAAKRAQAEELRRQKAEAAEAAHQARLRAEEERKAAAAAELERRQAAAELKRQQQEEARLQARQNALEKKKAAEEAAIKQAMNTPPPSLTPEATDAQLKTQRGIKIIDHQQGPSYTETPSSKAPPKSALPGEGSYFIQGTAYFSANARTLTPGSSATIDALAVRVQKLIQARPNVRVDIVGHADPLTEGQQADVLAEGRAEELMKELVARGVNRDHLHPAGAADTQPLTSKKGDPARNLNMRAEIRVPNG